MPSLKKCLPVLVVLVVAAFGAAPAQAIAPFNDNFAAYIDDGSDSSVLDGFTTTDATGEANEPNHAAQSLGAGCTNATTPSNTCLRSGWFKWTAPTGGIAVINTCGSDVDTTLSVWLDQGNTVGTLGPAFTANDDDSADLCADGPTNTDSYVAFPVDEGQAFRIAVAGKAAAQGGYNLRIYETADSRPNDAFNSPVFLASTGDTKLGTTDGFTGQADEPSHGGISLLDAETFVGGTPFCTASATPDAACNPSAWFTWTAPASGTYNVNTCAAETNYDTVLAVYTGTSVGSLTEIGSNDDAGNACTVGRHSKVVFNATVGTAYRIAVAGLFGSSSYTGDFRINLAAGTSNGGGNNNGGNNNGSNNNGGNNNGNNSAGGGVLITSPVLSGSSSAGSATASSNGTVTLKKPISCEGAGPDCDVLNTGSGSVPAALVSTSAKKKTVKLGKSSYTIKAGTKGKVKIKLSKKARKLLKRARKIKAKIKIRVTRGGTVVKKTVKVTIKAPKRKKR